MRMAGSSSVTILLSRKSMSSSRNSEVWDSISGRAPVDSPTRIMAMASSGTRPVLSRESERDCPSRTCGMALRKFSETHALLMDVTAVSREGTMGMPPPSMTPRERVNWDRENMWASWPRTGSLSRKRSTILRPRGVRYQTLRPQTTAITPRTMNTISFCMNCAIPMRILVGSGSLASSPL